MPVEKARDLLECLLVSGAFTSRLVADLPSHLLGAEVIPIVAIASKLSSIASL
jgi:hypothetical protein